MITFDDRELRQLEADFKTFGRRAYPHATRNTLNTAAFETRTQTRENIANDVTNRNAFTKNSIRVDMARGMNIPRQEAVTGSTAPYFDDLEFGGTTDSPIATASASGEGESVRERKKLPRRANKLASINLRRNRGGRGRSKKAKNAERIRTAGRGSQGFVFLDLQRTKGIFKITGSRKRPKIKMMWIIDGKQRVTKAKPTLGPATNVIERKMPEIYKAAMIKQARRDRLFGWG